MGGVGHGGGIETVTLVLDDDLDRVPVDAGVERDDLRGIVLVPVPEGVGQRLLEGEPDGEATAGVVLEPLDRFEQ